MAEAAPAPTPEPTPAPAPTPSAGPAPAPTPAPTPEPAPAPDVADWRAGIKDEAARNFAKDSTDIEHLAKRGLEMRQKLSNAIVRPGKDAKPEEVAAYRKAMDIPEKPEDYVTTFARPEHISEDEFKGEAVQGLMKAFGDVLHSAGIPKAAGAAIFDWYSKVEALALKGQVDADKAYATKAQDTLKAEWGKDYDVNKTFADRAVAQLFGGNLEEAKRVKDAQDRYVLDNPVFLKAFSSIGREMGEGTLGGTISQSEIKSLNDQLEDIQKRTAAAQQAGDTRLANKLYQDEQALIAKRDGNKGIVGANTRAA